MINLLMGLDALAPPRTGIGYYTEHLLAEFLAQPDELSIHGLWRGGIVDSSAIHALLAEDEKKPASHGGQHRLTSKLKTGIRAIPGAYPARQALRNALLRSKLNKGQWQLYHEPNFIPVHTGLPKVITVHDLSHIRYPQFHPAERVRFLNQWLPKAIESAEKIICVSEFTRQEVREVYPKATSKFEVTPLGVDRVFRPRTAEQTESTRKKWRLPYRGYIVSLATQEPRKNLAGLVDAYAKMPASLAAETPLVLIGGIGWKSHAYKQALSRVNPETHPIIVTGRLPRIQVAELLSGARLFVFPSFYEGFGLPIAEARSSGIPVMTTAYGAMREVAGPEAVLFKPESIEEALFETLKSPPQLPEPVIFNWSETAKKTLSVYQDIL